MSYSGIATCNCGQLSAQVSGTPLRISICHCLACQRRTGSPFGQQARFPRADVTISGESHRWTRCGDEGTCATFHFCPQCGATVYWEPQAMPEILMIPVGAFADPGFPAPTVSVYETRKHCWVEPPPEAEHFR